MATQATLTVWVATLYGDISGQVRRIGSNEECYDGLLLKKGSRMGSWLQYELKLKYFELDTERDYASVLVSLSGHEDEPLKLEWYISPDGTERVFYSMSTLPVSTRAETADLPSMLDYSP